MTEKERILKLEKENKELLKIKESYEARDRRSRLAGTWFVKRLGTFIAGPSLSTSIKNTINEFNEKKTLSTETVSDLSANIIKRFTRVGIFTLIIGLTPTILLFWQNSLIQKQNIKLQQQTELFIEQTKLLSNQNEKIQDQTILTEASRRSTQMFIMGEVLSDMNKELSGKKVGDRKLSDGLLARMISLSAAMRPYRFIENDVLISRPLSPERGQLLMALTNSRLDTSYLRQVVPLFNFQYADLRDIELSDAFLPQIDLSYSDLSNSNFYNINFDKAIMRNVVLDSALIIGNSILRDIYISESSLVNTALNGSLEHANIILSQLRSASIEGNIDSMGIMGCEIFELELNSGCEPAWFLSDEWDKVLFDFSRVNSPNWIQENICDNNLTALNKKYRIECVNIEGYARYTIKNNEIDPNNTPEILADLRRELRDLYAMH